MMNFYYYIYYRFLQYYDDGKTQQWGIKATAITLMGLLMTMHVLTITFIFFAVSNIKFDLSSNSALFDRFVIAPLILSPSILFLIISFRVNRAILKEKLKEFEKESKKSRINGGRKVIIYMLTTIILWFLSMASPILFH